MKLLSFCWATHKFPNEAIPRRRSHTSTTQANLSATRQCFSVLEVREVLLIHVEEVVFIFGDVHEVLEVLILDVLEVVQVPLGACPRLLSPQAPIVVCAYTLRSELKPISHPIITQLLEFLSSKESSHNIPSKLGDSGVQLRNPPRAIS